MAYNHDLSTEFNPITEYSVFCKPKAIFLGRFENFEILDWMVPRNAVFQKAPVSKFTFSLAGV
jgi:hypothetical protein